MKPVEGGLPFQIKSRRPLAHFANLKFLSSLSFDSENKSPVTKRTLRDERGVALLLTIFTIAIGTILVVEFASMAEFDRRIGRRYSESVQGDYVLKSGLALAQALLEQPKQEGVQEDWLGEPWNLISAAPSLPVAGFNGDLRLSIGDQDGKIDLNSILENGSGGSTAPLAGSGATNRNNALFWKNSLAEIFRAGGFNLEQYEKGVYRTRGNTAFEADNMVASIQDWIDTDSEPYSSDAFSGTGFESGSLESLYLNRRLRSLSELLLVPGMTAERLGRVAPFIKVASTSSAGTRINVNTAPLQVLVAMGLAEAEAIELVEQRTAFPIPQEILTALIAGNVQLQSKLKVNSSEFMVLARVEMATSSRWLRAFVRAGGAGSQRTSIILRKELFRTSAYLFAGPNG